MTNSRVIPTILLLLVSLLVIPASVWANTDSTGGATGAAPRGAGPAYGFPITITASGTLQSIGVNWADTQPGNVRVALYTPGSNKPASLLVDSGTVPITTTIGWQDVPVSAVSVTAGNYWVAIQISVGKTVYTISASRSYYYPAGGFGPFAPTWSATSNQDPYDQWNMRVTYSTGSFTATHASFSASASGSTVQASLGYTNTLAGNVVVVFSFKDSSGTLQDSEDGTATSGVSGGTASATSKSLSLGTYTVSWQAYLASDTTFSNPIDSSTPSEQKTVTTAPPLGDFIITVVCSPPSQTVNGVCSQTVNAGTTASYSLNIQYGSSLTATVSLASSGCPPSATCTFNPNSVTATTSVTLSVASSTALTPTGPYTITVTASSTSPTLSHSITVQLTVNGATSFPVTVHAGATQVIVSISWSGSGTAPVTLVGPGQSPILPESAATVFDRTTIPSGASTPTYIHRVTFPLTTYSPTSAQTWNVLVSISVPSGYTITIDVS